MTPNNINELINLVPKILIYIVPGYLYYKIFNYVLNWKDKTIKNNIFEYVVVSYVLCTVVKSILGIFYNEVNMNLPQIIVSLLILSAILGYFMGIFIKSDKFTKVRRFFKINRTINNNIFNDIIDKKVGTWARVYLKDDKLVYYGSVILFEKKDKYEDGCIVLNDYEVYKYQESKILEETLPQEGEKNSLATIKLSEINRIETIYPENSRLIDNLLGEKNKENETSGQGDIEKESENNIMGNRIADYKDKLKNLCEFDDFVIYSLVEEAQNREFYIDDSIYYIKCQENNCDIVQAKILYVFKNRRMLELSLEESSEDIYVKIYNMDRIEEISYKKRRNMIYELKFNIEGDTKTFNINQDSKNMKSTYSDILEEILSEII
ncbi:hypothetical protein JUM001_15590 [Clostridium perfringens]|uniref:hypothetical protein n=1 Tax=Clostridium perfringens TaxID=1502 RepID=UPI002209C9F4|nr:hypothetical protein [Clostridium perfringens]BDS17325.1 hypothetical protein JUM001_15590 [Clostridium perfringens]